MVFGDSRGVDSSECLDGYECFDLDEVPDFCDRGLSDLECSASACAPRRGDLDSSGIVTKSKKRRLMFRHCTLQLDTSLTE